MNILFYLVPKSDVVYVYEDNTLQEAMQIMKKERFSTVPVLARDGRYIGSLSEGDILWQLEERLGKAREVSEQMRIKQLHRHRENQPVNIDCRMDQLLNASVSQNFIPVIDDNRTFIGIITRRSILKYFMERQDKEEV
ncbi:MAG: CBS domain-containing protein [Lachnospiraceae bacterium]|nr:CBS domain-containing protein [Lachnospiraceae bacterium]